MIFTTLASLFVLLNSTLPSVPVTEHDTSVSALPAVAVVAEQRTSYNGNLKEDIHAYFEDIPIMSRVAFCESSFRHFDEDGKVLRGIVDRDDIGVMQINERYHGESAKNLGYDLHSFEDNLEFARLLYSQSGLKPWNASAKCWSQES